MSVYSSKTKGWRFDFIQSGKRYLAAGFPTKREARAAEAAKRREVASGRSGNTTPTDMAFLDLVNRRLDHVRAYNSPRHYTECQYLARRWVARWGDRKCSEITQRMIEQFILDRAEVSNETANKELRYLRSCFNFGLKKKPPWITVNPTSGIRFLPVEERPKYVPPLADIERVIALAEQETKDYLIAVADLLARVSEVNGLTWPDVDLRRRTVTLYTRKKKGGNRRAREVAMTERLYEVLVRRFQERDGSMPWVFWHTYWSSKTGERREGPYQDRKRIMRTLCRRAGVRYFRFHALRHAGASILDDEGVAIGTIQRILGHEKRTTTEIYLHSLGESERLAMAKLEQARKKVPHQVPHQGQNSEKRRIEQFL